MPELKMFIWMAMPPTAFLSLASLLTYVAFRLHYLASTPPTELNHLQSNGNINSLRSAVLPWAFFGFELLILSKLIMLRSARLPLIVIAQSQMHCLTYSE